ncbi:MAG: gliding motility protein GldN [Bacteroidota bacterium]|jgi:gliding motility associated protien GldN
MKIKKSLLLLSIVLICSHMVQAQNVLDGVYVRENNPQRRVVPLSFLREADVMWSKKVWRIIDLKEKMNLPFGQPEEVINDRRSLNRILFDAVLNGELTAYSDEEFIKPLFREEFLSSLVKSDKVPKLDEYGEPVINAETGQPDSVQTGDTLSPTAILQYRIKEEWFFDKQRSVMDVRIVGMAPLSLLRDSKGNIIEGVPPTPLFWIYFPEARKIFSNQEVFMRGNDSDRRTWDDIFLKRMFSSYIYKENNVFDRRIQDYVQGMDALLEAERIKMDITNLEHDLWEF